MSLFFVVCLWLCWLVRLVLFKEDVKVWCSNIESQAIPTAPDLAYNGWWTKYVTTTSTWGSKIIPHDISVIVGFPYSSQNFTWISLLHCMVNRDLFRAPKALTHQNVVWFTVVPYHPCMLCLCSCWLISMVPINLYWQTKKNGHGRHWIYILPMDSIRP